MLSTWKVEGQESKPPTWEDALLGKRLVTLEPHFHRNRFGVFACIDPPVPDVTLPNHLAITTTPMNSDPHTSDQARSLLTLPAEIRNKIMREVFRDVKVEDWNVRRGATPASIIFTCKQLYNEVRDRAKEACTFRFEDLPPQHRLFSTRFGGEDDLKSGW